jgi:hypothetical protein
MRSINASAVAPMDRWTVLEIIVLSRESRTLPNPERDKLWEDAAIAVEWPADWSY